jgi:hypothetical protein
MHADSHARLYGFARKLFGEFRADDGLRDVVFGKFLCAVRRGVAENQDRQLRPDAPELLRFLQIGDGEPVCAKRFVNLGQTLRAVPVGVGLDLRSRLSFPVSGTPELPGNCFQSRQG